MVREENLYSEIRNSLINKYGGEAIGFKQNFKVGVIGKPDIAIAVDIGSVWLPPKSRPKIGKNKVDH